MSFCEQDAEHLYRLMELISGEYTLRMNTVVRVSVGAGWKSRLQNNQDLHILFVLGGEGRYILSGGQEIALVPGTLVFISQNVEHYAEIGDGNHLRIAGLRFRIEDRAGRDVTGEKVTPFFCSFRTGNLPHYNDLTWKIHQLYYKKKDDISRALCAALVFDLLHDFYESADHGGPESVPGNPMEEVRRLIEEKPFEKISISGLAREAGISTRYLQKKFKEYYRFTPKEYHLQIQMNMALALLEQEGLTVAAAADKLGYSDPFTFSKQFRRYFGYPPSHVRL